MTTKIIDGKAIALEIKQQIKKDTMLLKDAGITPGLAVILIGENAASQVYVRNKIKACEEVGFNSILEQYPADFSEQQLLKRINALNHDNNIDGILVQLPLPEHIDSHKIIESISPHKDVDGFHVASAGALMTNGNGFLPCTPLACIKILEHINYNLNGKHAVVVGRSNIVGKPIALMLLQKNATVTICHSKTKNLTQHLLQADLIIAAVGKAKMIKAEMIKPGAVVIDVGINRDENGKLCGDVDFCNIKNRTSYITPVPGGVGPMTITMLLQNTLQAVKRRITNFL